MPPTRADREQLVRFFDELSPRSLYLRFHGQPTGRRSARRTGPRIGLDRARSAPRVNDGGGRRSNRRSRQLRSASRSCERRGRLHRRRRLSGQGHRDALARAAGRAGRSSWDRAFRRGGDGRQRADDRRLRRRGLRGLENLRRRRGGDDLSHREEHPTTPHASRLATTPRSSHRCGRSSRRGRSPSSERRLGGARSAASSSATSLRASTLGPPTP